MFWLTGGNVYDVEAGAFRHADIAVDNQRIAATTSDTKPAAGDGVVDVRGAMGTDAGTFGKPISRKSRASPLS
jgi:adenine deaminase